MNKYTVTVRQIETTEACAFQMIRDIEVEFLHNTEDGNEVYVIYVERNIDVELDQADAVISYSSSEVHPTDEEIDEELRILVDDFVYEDEQA